VLVFFNFKRSLNQEIVFENTNHNCQPHSETLPAIVKWVYDGDTILVTDSKNKNKRKVRILGIDTPETKHHQVPEQAYAAKAREQLRFLLKNSNNQIHLEFDKVKFDKYGRSLAHIYLQDGNNISEWLLKQGYAKTLVIPPNVKHSNCYRVAEQSAQSKKLKLWKLIDNQPQLTNKIDPNKKGYIRIKGEIANISYQKKKIILNFSEKQPKPIEIHIKKRNLSYFKDINIDQLVGKHVILSGVLKNKEDKRTITLSHVSQLELLSND